MKKYVARKSLTKAIWLSAGISALTPLGVSAEEDQKESLSIEEVIVTVRYKNESLQDSPVAVSAFNEGLLEKMAAQDFRDLSPATPNVQINQVAQFPNSAAVSIRGMGSAGIESTQEPRTGVSVDGIFFTRPIASLIDFFDVAQVEVLRGPQGTSFGKNSLAGGIRVQSIKPSGQFSGKLETNIGNHGRKDIKVAIDSNEIADQLSFRMAYLNQNYEGHYKNRFDGTIRSWGGFPTGETAKVDKDLGGEDLQSLRLQALWTPTDDFDMRFIYTKVHDRGDGTPGNGVYAPGYQACTSFPTCGETDGDPWTVGRDFPSVHATDQEGYTVSANYDMGDWVLTSITGYVETEGKTLNDFDNTEWFYYPTVRNQIHDQLSQEVRIAGNFDNDLELVFGLYYMSQEHEMVQSYPSFGFADYTTQDAESKAAFAQAIYSINEDWNATFGVRYTEEHKEFYRNFYMPVAGLGFDPSAALGVSEGRALTAENPWTGISPDSFDTDNLSMKFVLDYHINNDVMAYVQFAEGFKAGEFAPRADTLQGAEPSDDETSQSFEVGMKSTWFDERLRLNVAAFWSEFDNLQTSIFVPNGSGGDESVLVNAGKSESKGLEVELKALIADNFVVNTSIGLLDAVNKEFCVDLDGASPAPLSGTSVSSCGNVTPIGDGSTELIDMDYSYLDNYRSPDVQAHIDFEWTIPFAGSELLWRTSATYTDSYTNNTQNHPDLYTKSHTMWDASLTWLNADETIKVMAWGKNLTEEEVVAAGVDVVDFVIQQFWAPPRTFGVTATYNW